ncbi:methyltransferase, TIGR04325 family [Pedobacter aquatilis]|uniref:methyltransferase, TIGR04325 family n=1 Tax=Pedobacter aquatilis TaxID=351343 RepID=UPI00292DCD16|nr:methyltransferase, TIGR04325 family [Pedobacter aquatilis]
MNKALLKQFIPPIITNALVKSKYTNTPVKYSGNYNTWIAAKQDSIGYDAANILEKVKTSILKVKNGEAAYERDSLAQDNIQYSWPLLGALQHISIIKGNKLSVIDFGGSLGSSYFQNRLALSHLNNLRWTIIEQEHFVKCGKEFIEDEVLKFHYTIDEACLENDFDVMVLSGVHQCMPDTVNFTQDILSKGFEYILIDRVSFIEDSTRLVVQTVPDWLYRASYPTYLFREEEFIQPYLSNYEVIYDFDSQVDEDEISDDGKRMYWKGFFLKKRILNKG